MEKENVLTNFKFRILRDDYVEDGAVVIANELINCDRLYSYVIYSVYTGEFLTAWDITCNISQTPEYNTITATDAFEHINTVIYLSLKNDEKKYVVGYKQPPLDLIVKLFEPLVHKLSQEQSHYWPIEYDDLCQMCRLCICNLYQKGYYIHKSLLRRTFTNYVLMYLRHDKYKPLVVSTDEPVAIDELGDKLLLEDTLVDTKFMEEQEDEEDREVELQILEEMKALVIEEIGPRQWDQLVREYKNKQVSSLGSTTVYRLKEKFKALGITRKLFRRYY